MTSSWNSRPRIPTNAELSGITSDEGFVFPSLGTALQEQLGLRLVKGTAPFEMFVVDSADKVPTEN